MDLDFCLSVIRWGAGSRSQTPPALPPLTTLDVSYVYYTHLDKLLTGQGLWTLPYSVSAPVLEALCHHCSVVDYILTMSSLKSARYSDVLSPDLTSRYKFTSSVLLGYLYVWDAPWVRIKFNRGVAFPLTRVSLNVGTESYRYVYNYKDIVRPLLIYDHAVFLRLMFCIYPITLSLSNTTVV